MHDMRLPTAPALQVCLFIFFCLMFLYIYNADKSFIIIFPLFVYYVHLYMFW